MAPSTKRKASSSQDASLKKNKTEEENSILALGMDDDYLDDGDVNEYDDSLYGGEAADDSGSDGDDENQDYIDGDDDEEMLDDSEAAVGRPTILEEKNDKNDKRFVNLKVKNTSITSDKPSVAPTNEEIQNLKETQDLFNSNLFRLQLLELFKQVKVDYSKLTSLESALHQIKSIIEKMPDQDVDVYSNNIDNVKIFDSKGESKDVSIKFTKPTNVDVIGSFMSRTVLKQNSNVDMIVEIPSPVLNSKDANDYKYFTKRNLYIWTIRQELIKHARFVDTSFTNFDGDINKQILVIKPKEDAKTGAKTKFTIRIIPTIAKETFKYQNKFNPNTNCILLQNETNQFKIETFKEDDSSAQQQPLPTTDKVDKKKKPFDSIQRSPFYNNAILEDIFIADHMQLIYSKTTSAPVLVDTILLLKLWLDLKQIPTINGFHLTMILIHLYTNGKINKSMSSYQAFRMVMVFITRDFQSKPYLYMNLDEESPIASTPLVYREAFEKLYPVAIVDPSGMLNVASRVSVWGLRTLVQEAKLVLENLDSGNGFEEIFMTKNHFYLSFDLVIKVQLDKDNCLNTTPTNDYYQVDRYLEHKIYTTLRKAFSKRIKKISIVNNNAQKNATWTTDMPQPEDRIVTVGINVNPENWLSVIDLGPAADHVNAAKFREFWGAKSQIRRFKDGSISEAVTWTPKNNLRHLVLEEITKYILNLHLKVPTTNVSSIVHQLDALIYNPEVEDQTLLALKAKDTLVNTIHSLNLPLAIETFPSMAPGLRYTSVHVTQDTTFTNNEPLTVLLHFEQNKNWTNDIESINALKTAFILKIARELQDTPYNPKLSKEYVDLQCEGFLFRLIPYYPKEADFMREQWKVENLPQLELLQRSTLHHTYVHSLHTAHPTYGVTVRLALRWIHSHLFTEYIDHKTIELLVASLYRVAENSSQLVPQTALSGFLRFLFLLYTFNFEEKPVIVDHLDNITKDDLNKIQSTFDLQKQSANPPLIFIATDKDRTNTWFRSTAIKDQAIFNKIKLFAEKSIHLIESNYLENNSTFNWLSVFETSFLEYDVVFQLNETLVPSYSREISNLIYNKKFTNPSIAAAAAAAVSAPTTKKSGGIIFKNVSAAKPKPTTNSTSTQNSGLVCGLNPVSTLVSIIKEKYSNYCKVYYDSVGGSKILLKWNDDIETPFAFKPSKSQYTTPMFKKDNLIKINIDEILNEITLIGGKLVKSFKKNENTTTSTST
ncbi:hypothetical protein CYY_004957 [Polysphondylium violaceum]|uniref:U3 small nucleolar RNA-associated protein 22 n=1 Tax=Polysphondylium violaceum TaxID=133409 RepID=A0A8J4V797_9MYCE|nr:hypothetical protein CYY_004957 [Polysphondylium violaceum]